MCAFFRPHVCTWAALAQACVRYRNEEKTCCYWKGNQDTDECICHAIWLYLGSLGTGLCEVHELAQSQGVQAGDVKLHLLPRAAGQAGVAGMHQGHGPLKLLGGQALQCWYQRLLSRQQQNKHQASSFGSGG